MPPGAASPGLRLARGLWRTLRTNGQRRLLLEHARASSARCSQACATATVGRPMVAPQRVDVAHLADRRRAGSHSVSTYTVCDDVERPRRRRGSRPADTAGASRGSRRSETGSAARRSATGGSCAWDPRSAGAHRRRRNPGSSRRTLSGYAPTPCGTRVGRPVSSRRGWPCPGRAMSNAVPCAGVVIGIGRPPCTVTPRWKPISFIAIWPWSWYIVTTPSYWRRSPCDLDERWCRRRTALARECRARAPPRPPGR